VNFRLQSMLRRFGVPVVSGETRTLGMFDATAGAEPISDERGMHFAPMQVETPSVLVEWSKVSGLKTRAPINVDGRAYTVRAITREDDGAVARIWLLEAA